MGRAAQDRITRLRRALGALKADDEEAYMKLIDTAKDTRITHLLKQADAYLDSLAFLIVIGILTRICKHRTVLIKKAIFARTHYKLDVDVKVIQAGRFDNKSTQEEQEEFLRSILEADQEEENEEASDTNGDEINEIITCSDEESALFREVDIQHERDTLEAWRKANNRGKPPPPLMHFEEVPECYRRDEPFEDNNELEEMEGRGHRRRTVVIYNDGLSNDQWAMALEDGEDLQELSEHAREKNERRITNKLIRETESNTSPTPEEDTPMDIKEKTAKGRWPTYICYESAASGDVAVENRHQ
ncbi:hypothetical protein A0H81_10243 [Grifola frondosa]|uniref:Snf2 ATP coupling domain-containing protein n=1 Tax=Grifola frondosa TaxID=5627 RepID=A0A1C7LZF0_GRIFR|nr:hypothetical protein A0H81_10243 [Grifola frondosa]